MDSLKTGLMIRALLGAVIGMFISVSFMVMDGSGNELVLDRSMVLIQLAGSAVYGAIPMGGSIVYDIESWSLLRATCIHFFSTMIAFLMADFLLGWFDVSELPVVLIIMIVLYACIWLAEYFSWKAEIKNINIQLEKLKQNDIER